MASPAVVYEGDNNVYSDITKYALTEHIEDLLKSKYPDFSRKAKTIRRYSIVTNNDGDHRVWAPQAITEEEKQVLYDKAAALKSPNDPKGWVVYE